MKVEEDFHTPERVQLEHAPEEHICLKLSDEFNNESKEYSRGPYKSYTVEQKEGAVKMIL